MRNSVRVQRIVRDMTQEDLAKAMKVTRQTVIAIENGKYDPSLKLALRLSGFFGMKVEELFNNEEDE